MAKGGRKKEFRVELQNELCDSIIVEVVSHKKKAGALAIIKVKKETGRNFQSIISVNVKKPKVIRYYSSTFR